MNKIYELADKVLEEMLKEPYKKYYMDDMMQLVDCTKDEMDCVYAILRNRKYADFPVDNKGGTTPGWDFLKLSNSGADFILSGGFAGQIRKENLMTENIEASIRASKTSESVAILQKKALIYTLIIAALTLIILFFQFLVAIGVFDKSISFTSESVNNGKVIKDSIHAFGREFGRTAHFNQIID
jgi:hypothetical protein